MLESNNQIVLAYVGTFNRGDEKAMRLMSVVASQSV
jgi:hypothetical protein